MLQARVLELYDPERSRDRARERQGVLGPPRSRRSSTRAAPSGRRTSGAGLVVLAEPTGSPSMLAARERLLKAFPKADLGLVVRRPWNNDDNAREGAALA
jgi:hypothetical protein